VVPTPGSTGVLSTVVRVKALNVDMGRCTYCHSVVRKDEDYCYVCADSVPKEPKAAVQRRPVSTFTNLVFLASLGFTFYCFFGEHKLSLPVTLVISSSLLLIRILAERLADKNSN
jgi:hypothetical protein